MSASYILLHGIETPRTFLECFGAFLKKAQKLSSQSHKSLRSIRFSSRLGTTMLFTLISLLVSGFVSRTVNAARWSPEQANAWYRDQPWYFGANFVPSSSVNEIDMWQAFDTVTIERELRWASQINMNMMRVFLHVLLYQQDSQALYKKMDDFLAIANRFRIRIIFVLFDECGRPDPKLGPQPAPVPGIHNARWVQCPGQDWLRDNSKWPLLKQWVHFVVSFIIRSFPLSGTPSIFSSASRTTHASPSGISSTSPSAAGRCTSFCLYFVKCTPLRSRQTRTSH